MIKIEHTHVVGWEPAIRGMRNPKNSWHLSDSKMVNATLKSKEVAPGVKTIEYVPCEPYFSIGPNDHKLMMSLRKGGTDDRKFMRMIVVYMDITAPLYWWKEFDTYKVGTVANSCSTMHKIHSRDLNMDDFSTEHLYLDSQEMLEKTIKGINAYREDFERYKDKDFWYQMIQMLPTSYNQKRTIMLNYEVLANMYKSRKTHKLQEWRYFCSWIEDLPYSELITGTYKVYLKGDEEKKE